MTKREKTLGWIFGVLLAVIGGGILFTTGIGKISEMRAQSRRLAERADELETVIRTRAVWEQRSEWITGAIPEFETAGKASAELISRVDTVTAQFGVEVEEKELLPEIEDESEGGYFDSAGLKIRVTGPDESVVRFLHALQQPAKFTGVTALAIEPSAGGLSCEAEIRQFYSRGGNE
ncbi:MAG: hypothetical protein HKN23_11615 [Verrucomicrobiales bacterium]|nr:hypothetical protein [Verrucomicrobiales bacterium]